MAKDLDYERGDACNRVKIGGITELFGDPEKKTEKPYTIVLFPGGHVEIARTLSNEYWVHVAVRETDPGEGAGTIKAAKMNAEGRYCNDANATLRDEIEAGEVSTISFLISPSS